MGCSEFLFLLGFAFIVSVQSQLQCFQTDTCSGSGVPVATEDECCLRTPTQDAVGLYHQTAGGTCMPCTRGFGFLETTFEGREISAAYDIPIGFYSGPVSTAAFGIDVSLTTVTTRNTDVKLNTPRVEFDGVGSFQNVSISLIPDNVAQELNETFTVGLGLSSLPPAQVSSTTRAQLNGIIIDTDRVSFLLSQADYSALERNLLIAARLQKGQDKRLANPVTFTITPLTRDQAMARNLILPTELTMLEDVNSPQYAVEADFNTTVLNVRFPADEVGSRIDSIDVDIPIVDDALNERNEQTFVISSAVSDAVNVALVNNTGRNISIGRILNDDDLVIGFSQRFYFTDEPSPTPALFSRIMLVKENNVVSEQTFSVRISIGVPENYTNAVIGMDYNPLSLGGQIMADQRFSSTQQFIGINVILFPDNVFDGDKAARFDSAPTPSTPIVPVIPYSLPSSGITFASTTLVIRDRQVATIGFEELSYTVNEAAGSVDVYVVVTNPLLSQDFIRAGDIQLGIQSVAGTASLLDYTSTTTLTTNVTFSSSNANSGSARRMRVTVFITDDSILEGQESFTLQLVFAAPTQNVVLQPNVTQIFITDNDALTIGFDPVTYSTGEPGIVVFRIVSFGGQLSGDINFQFFTSDGTAESRLDYLSETQNVTFGPGRTSMDIPVRIVADTLLESNETFFGNLRFPSGVPSSVRLTPAIATATINDDDSAVIGFVSDEMVIEGTNSSVSLDLQVLMGTLGREVVVSVSVMDGTATAPSDYSGAANQLVTFAAGSTIRSIVLSITNDDIVEAPSESFVAVASLFSPNIAVSIDPPMATVTIEDDDVATIGFEELSYTVNEAAGSVDVYVVVTIPSLAQDFVRTGGIQLGIQSVAGTASLLDYTSTTTLTTNVTFTPSSANDANARRMRVTVFITDDSILEGPESFTLQLVFAAPTRNVVLQPNVTQIFITDDDALTIGFDPVTYSTGESGIVVFRIVSFGGQLSGDVNFQFFTTDGTAESRLDYLSETQNVTFGPGRTSIDIPVRIVADTLLELNETFFGNLRFPSGVPSRVRLTPAIATATITDDDSAVIGFVSDEMVIEGTNSSVSLDLQVLMGTLGREVVVSVSVMDGTATAPSDYSGAANQLVTFAAGSTIRSVVLSITNDDIVEAPSESFVAVASLTSPNIAVSIDPPMATVAIEDDDELAITLAADVYNVIESDGTADVTINLMGSTARNIVVNFYTVDGTAVSTGGERDYDPVVRTLTFSPSSSSLQTMTVSIPIVDDPFVERLETLEVFINLTIPDMAVSLGVQRAVINIRDNDAVVIGFGQRSYSIGEQFGPLGVVIRIISGQLRIPVAFNFATADGSARAGSDYVSTFRSLTFNRSTVTTTIDVNIVDDNIHEQDELFYGQLSTTENPSMVMLDPANTSISILDNEVVTFSFRQQVITIMEGVGLVTVFIDRNGTTDMDFLLRISGPLQAESGRRIDDTLTFPASESEIPVSFVVIDDDIALEDTESIVWTLNIATVSDRASVSPFNTTNIQIIDDDELVLSLETLQQNVPESQNTSASIIFSNPFATDFTINTSSIFPENVTVLGIATTGADFIDFSGVLTASAGVNGPSSPLRFDIQIVNDEAVEEEQCISVNVGLGADTDNMFVSITNNSAIYCIQDDDSVSVGFTRTETFTNEGAVRVRLQVTLLSGILERSVEVFFNTNDGTATSPADFVSVTTVPVQLDSTTTTRDILIPINDDNILENDEYFYGNLTTSDGAVVLTVPGTTVFILETLGEDIITVGFQPVNYTFNEVDGFALLTVVILEGGLERDVTVQFSTSPGSATEQAPMDYTGTTVDLTFTPAISQTQARVPIINDTRLEGTEFFFGNLVDTPMLVTADPDLSNVIITEDVTDRVVVGFDPSSFTVNETEGTAVFTVRVLRGILERSVIVTFSTADGTATSTGTADFEARSNVVLQFDAGTSSQQVSVTIINDDILENPETFFGNLATSDGGVQLEPSTATVTIVEEFGDDIVTIGFSPEIYSVNEVAGFVEIFAVLLRGTLERTVTIPFRTSSGTATHTDPKDFDAVSETLTFSASISRVSIRVNITNDDIVEDTENFFGHLEGRPGLVIASPDLANINITEDTSDRIQIGFDPFTYTVNEQVGRVILTVRRLSGVLERAVRVVFFTSDGTATSTAPEDFTGVTSQVVVFDPSTDANNVSVTIINDQILEDQEFFFGNLSTSDGAVSLAVPSAQVFIDEVEGEDAVTIGFRPQNYSVNEVDNFVRLSVVLLQGTLERDVNISFATMSGTATENGERDYIGRSLTLMFTPTVSQRDVDVVILNDDIVENAEEYFTGLLAGSSRVIASPDVAYVTITEDNADRIVVGFEPIFYTAVEIQGTVTLGVTLFSGTLEREAVVFFSTTDGSATSVAPADFVARSNVSLTFSPSINRTEVVVGLINDEIVEGREEFYGNLTVSDGAVTVSPDTATVSIAPAFRADEDRVEIGFDPFSYVVNETDGSVTFTIRVLNGTLEKSVFVTFFTSDGSATSTAPADFMAFSNVSLEFNAGTLSRQFTVPLINDDILEDPESFFGNLDSGDSEVIISQRIATVTILEQAGDDVVTVGFRPVIYSVNEVDGAVLLYAVLLDGTLERNVNVPFFTSSGSATESAPLDYLGDSRTLQFTPTISQHNISVTIVNDSIVEGTENFFGNLNGTAGLVIAAPDRATVTISEDIKDRVVIGLDRTEYEVSEGSGATVCARVLSGVLERNAMVTLTSADGSATVGADYSMVLVTFTFGPSVRVMCEQVNSTQDSILEATENFILRLTTSDSMVDLRPDRANVNITDNDRITIGLEQTRFEVNEENVGLFFAEDFVEVCASIMSGTLETDAVALLSTVDGSATAPADYSTFSQMLTFTPMDPRFCFNMSIVNDQLFEGQESFTVVLSTSDSSVDVQPDTAVIIITDDDQVTIGFSRTSDSIREDIPGFVTIFAEVISGQIQGRSVSVSYTTAMSTAPNAATSGVDFLPASGSLVFDNVRTRISFTVTIQDDDNAEGVESFLAQLTTTEDRVILAPDTTVIDILDDEVITIGFLDTLYNVTEGAGVATLEVGIITGNLQRDFVVLLTTDSLNVSNPANVPEDYQNLTRRLTFNSVTRNLFVNVTITDDSVVEAPMEVFQAMLSEVTIGTSATVRPNTAIVTIVDDDMVTIGMERSRVRVNESVGTVELCANIMMGSLLRDAVVTVVYENRNAEAGSDYVNTPVTLTFNAQVTRQCFEVSIIDDNDFEFDEEFFANLTTTDNQVRLSPSFSVVVITDLDRVSLGWERPLYEVQEATGSQELCAVLLSSVVLQVTLPAVNIQLNNGSAGMIDDFGAPSPSFFQFGRNSPIRQCTIVPIVSDNEFEAATENFFGILSLSANRVDITRRQTEVQIMDNDTITIGFNPATYRVNESDGDVELIIEILSGRLNPGVEVEVSLATSNGSALAGIDYISTQVTLTFTSSVTRIIQSVTVLQDDLDEHMETLFGELARVTPDTRIAVSPDRATVTILDDDVARIGFEMEMYVTREDTTEEVCAILMAPPTLARQVMVNLRSYDGSATAPSDYNSINTMLTFGPGIQRQCVNFTVPDDGIVEGEEVFIANLTSSDDVLLLPDSATIAIEERSTVLILFDRPVYNFVERDGTVSVTVVKDGDSDEAITVRVAGDPRVQDSLTSIPEINDTVTFNRGEFRKNVTFMLSDDSFALEPTEMYTVGLTILTGTDIARTSSPDTAIINARDDDELVIGFGRPNVTVQEDMKTFMMCVFQRGLAAIDYDVNITPQDLSAVDGSDYDRNEVPSAVTFKMGETLICFNSSSILDDTTAELTERFQLQITSTTPSSTLVTIERPTTDVFILDNDDVGIQVNDTVIGDPLYTVPILVPEDQLQALGFDKMTLCYEVHGESGHWFNLVTDECASVNTRYSSLSNTLNVMDSVAVRAIDDAMNCVNVQVNVQGCTAQVNGVPLNVMEQYLVGGVSIKRYGSRVRISVPNCQEQTLVMWVICERRSLTNPDNPDEILTGDMIKFVVMRGLNFGRQAHGLLGQFWNTRVDVYPFTGNLYDGSMASDRYVVNITTGNKPRSFTGWMYDLTWDHSDGPCLYVGNRQSGPIGEITDPNDPVIESLYTSYRVPSAFEEGEEYPYRMFDSSKCTV